MVNSSSSFSFLLLEFLFDKQLVPLNLSLGRCLHFFQTGVFIQDQPTTTTTTTKAVPQKPKGTPPPHMKQTLQRVLDLAQGRRISFRIKLLLTFVIILSCGIYVYQVNSPYIYQQRIGSLPEDTI